MSAPLLLDGPMGTEIDRLGGDTSLPLWSARALVKRPEMVQQIHLSYLEAGADILTTNTFRTQQLTLDRAGYPDYGEILTRRAVHLAQKARIQFLDDYRDYKEILIAGSIAPVEDCYSPELVPRNDILYHQHGLMAEWLASSGVDFFLVETMNTIREMSVVLDIVTQYDLPIWISFTTNSEGRILSGEGWEPILEQYTDIVEGIMVNCSSMEATEKVVQKFVKYNVPSWGLYPNFGTVDSFFGWQPGTIDPKRYSRYMQKWLELGPTIIGTCCGATPEETRQLRELIQI